MNGDTSLRGLRKSTALISGIVKSATQANSPVWGLISATAVAGSDPRGKDKECQPDWPSHARNVASAELPFLRLEKHPLRYESAHDTIAAVIPSQAACQAVGEDDLNRFQHPETNDYHTSSRRAACPTVRGPR